MLLGTYPFVTSSNTGLGGVITGLAVNPRKIKYVIRTMCTSLLSLLTTVTPGRSLG